MKNKCSLCRKDINKPQGHTKLDKPLCEFCVVRYEVLKTFPDFRESEEFGVEAGNSDVRSVNYKLLDVICYQHFLRRFGYYKKKFRGLDVFLLGTTTLSLLLSGVYIGIGFDKLIALVFGPITLFAIYLVNRLWTLRKFHKWQKSFVTKLSLGYENADVRGSVKTGNLIE